MNEFYRHRRALVLGGLGFIGSNLAIALAERGAQVTIVDSFLPEHGANWFNIDPVRDRVRVNVSDIRNAHTLGALVQRQDVVFNLAAQVSHVGSMREPLLDDDVNCRAHLTLLECCRRHNPGATVVLASTRQLYGRPRYLPVDEEHPVAPVDVNGVSKHAAEMYGALYHRVYGLRTVSLRLTNTYGPRMNLAGTGTGFVSVFLRQALSRARIDLFGGGEQRRDFNYVDDVVQAFLLAGEHEALAGREFNLGHPANHSLLEFVRMLQKFADFECRPVPFPPDHAVIDLGDCYSSFRKFEEATGWAPRVDLETGLTATMDYFGQFRKHYLERNDDSGI